MTFKLKIMRKILEISSTTSLLKYRKREIRGGICVLSYILITDHWNIDLEAYCNYLIEVSRDGII
jgi:hypothetical protein